MADMLPALEVAFVDRFWKWDDGKGLPAKPRWCPLTTAQQKDIHEESTSLTLLPDNRTFQKVAVYDSGIKLFQSEGMWNVESWSYVRALARPIGPDLVLSVHADHMTTEQYLKFDCRSCVSGRLLFHLFVTDKENLSMNVLGMRIKRRCVDEKLISPQQHVRLVSSVTGELMSCEIGFLWGPRVLAGLKPRMRLVKKTRFSKVETILAEASGGALSRSMERLYKLLSDSGLMYEQKINSKFIGVHTANRDGAGVSAKHVHDLLGDLVSLGWSQAEFRGICVEVADAERAFMFKYNNDLAQQSDGQIPCFQSDSMLKFCTIAGSHTNQVLRCFQSRVASTAQHVSDGTHLNVDKLRAHDEDFHEAVSEGAVWRVVSQAVPQRFPSFCALAQSAANAAGHLAREESELHLCRKIHAEVARQQSQGKDFVAYNDVKDAVLRSKPRAAGTVPALFVFTLRYSGGQAGHLLQETERFVRGQGHNSRALGPDVFEALNVESRGRDPQAQLRHMILHFAYTVEDARALTMTDIKKLLSPSMDAKTGRVVQILTDCKDLCSKHAVPSHIALKALGFLQVHMIAVLLQKKKIQKFDTVDEAAEDCVNTILRDAKLSFPNPYQHKASSSSPSGKTGKNDQAMVSAGFDIGQDVLRKSDSAKAKIQAMSATDVTLLVGKDVVKVPAKNFLAGEWKQFTAKAEALAVPFLEIPVNSLDFEIQLWRAKILEHMTAEEATGAKHYDALEVFLKPSKDVRTTKKFDKGMLQIVASTHRIDLKPAGSSVGSSICCGTADIQGEIYDILLSSCLQQTPKQVLHPFWVLRTSTNVAECNMELVVNAGDSLVLYKAATAAKPVEQSMWVRLTTGSQTAKQDRIIVLISSDPRTGPMAKPTEMQQVWAITGGMLKKKKWLVKTKEVEDKLFLQIDKWDRSFVQFVTGNTVQLKKEKDPHHLSIKAFQELLDLRKEACDRAYNRHIRDAAATAGDKEPQYRNAREADVYVAGRTVVMECPEVVFGGDTMPARNIAAIWSVKDPVLWMELTPENLDYLGLFMRRGLMEHQESDAPIRRRKKLRGEEARPIDAGSPKRKSRRGRKRKAPNSEEAAPLQEESPPPVPEESDSNEVVVNGIINGS
ncbi:unnamed protein product [Symbiodinium sp. CCMP2592]|nr:unnamed protein product [Symbiodinium sp. CCMP2592]